MCLAALKVFRHKLKIHSISSANMHADTKITNKINKYHTPYTYIHRGGQLYGGEGHYISIFTPEGHIPYTVGQKPVICHTRVAKIADLQAQNASLCDAF